MAPSGVLFTGLVSYLCLILAIRSVLVDLGNRKFGALPARRRLLSVLLPGASRSPDVMTPPSPSFA